jgi:SpoVK/Ycf46/Vps4 family AAA+-type ATPase
MLQKDSPVKNDIHDLNLLLESRVKLIITESWEEQRVLETMAALAIKRARTWFTWDHIDGLQRLGFGADIDDDETSDPEKALECVRKDTQQSIYVFCDLHPFLDNPRLVRLLKLAAMNTDTQAPTIMLVSHQIKLPPELSRLAVRLELSMPSDEQLAAIIREEAASWAEQNQGLKVRTDNRTLEQVVRNLRGTTHEEARRLARKLIVDDGAITQEDVPALNKAKFSLLDMQGVLSFEQDTAHFADVGGLHHFKQWLLDRQTAFLGVGAIKDAPKGVMLAGVQGAGKSLAAKAVAGVWGLPLLRLDFAALFNKYIGETEKNLREALKMADCMEPCVLWIDEIEKGLAPDSGDQGVSRRLLGTLLTWMSERQSRVFLVATANEVSQLPPELIRKGRLDELFFVDLPEMAVREDILRIHLQRRDMDAGSFDLSRLALASEGFSGAEIEQAIVSAVYAASARQQSVTDSHVLAALTQTSPLSVVMSERVQALRTWGQERAVMAG